MSMPIDNDASGHLVQYADRLLNGRLIPTLAKCLTALLRVTDLKKNAWADLLQRHVPFSTPFSVAVKIHEILMAMCWHPLVLRPGVGEQDSQFRKRELHAQPVSEMVYVSFYAYMIHQRVKNCSFLFLSCS